MLVDLHTSAAQLKAAARWAQDGEGMAEVMLAVDAEGYLAAGQGDERAVIGETGELIEGECGIEPLSVPEALTLNNTDQDSLILAAEAILGELGGRIDEDDPDGPEFLDACNAWDKWRRMATRLARAAGKAPEDPTPAGVAIARMGRAMIDPDYDPAAEDEDGVPIFSDETRAERPTDDPRYRRGAH